MVVSISVGILDRSARNKIRSQIGLVRLLLGFQRFQSLAIGVKTLGLGRSEKYSETTLLFACRIRILVTIQRLDFF